MKFCDFRRNFGQGRGLCAMDAAAVRERGGELAYELFAVLIHSVSPTT